MHAFAKEGFDKRRPGSKKIRRSVLVSIGPDAEWSLDGFDNLLEAGFGVYGICDKGSGNWLHYTVVPPNCFASVAGVIFLQCAQKHGGNRVDCK